MQSIKAEWINVNDSLPEKDNHRFNFNLSVKTDIGKIHNAVIYLGDGKWLAFISSMTGNNYGTIGLFQDNRSDRETIGFDGTIFSIHIASASIANFGAVTHWKYNDDETI